MPSPRCSPLPPFPSLCAGLLLDPREEVHPGPAWGGSGPGVSPAGRSQGLHLLEERRRRGATEGHQEVGGVRHAPLLMPLLACINGRGGKCGGASPPLPPQLSSPSPQPQGPPQPQGQSQGQPQGTPQGQGSLFRPKGSRTPTPSQQCSNPPSQQSTLYRPPSSLAPGSRAPIAGFSSFV